MTGALAVLFVSMDSTTASSESANAPRYAGPAFSQLGMVITQSSRSTSPASSGVCAQVASNGSADVTVGLRPTRIAELNEPAPTTPAVRKVS